METHDRKQQNGATALILQKARETIMITKGKQFLYTCRREVLLSLILLLILLSYVFGCALRRTEKTAAGKGLLLLVIFYLLCPGSPSYLWTSENMGRFDMYLLIMALAAIICCIHMRSARMQIISIRRLCSSFSLCFSLYI